MSPVAPHMGLCVCKWDHPEVIHEGYIGVLY